VDLSTTAVNYNANEKMGGATGFQTGSTFKPIVLAQWLTEGHTLRESVDATRTDYTGSKWQSRCDSGGVYTVGHKWRVIGPSSRNNAWNATANSTNTAYAAMEMKLDLCDIADLAASMGVVRADGAEWNHGPSQVFGTNEVTPLSMAGAYATFAAEGQYCVPLVIDKMVGPEGNELAIPAKNCKEVMSADVARGVTAALANCVTNGTCYKARLDGGRPVAGKTGTTEESMAVSFSGYTPQLATHVWAGNPVNGSEPMHGDWYGAYGGQMLAPVFKQYMEAALADRPKEKFNPPPKEMTRAPSAKVPDVVGQTAEQAKQALKDAGFSGTVAKQPVPSDKPAGTVVSQSPSGGSYYELGSNITLNVSSGVPPEPSPLPAQPDPGVQPGGGGGTGGG
jgi:membrane peptidoglycan carboxypeptidase